MHPNFFYFISMLVSQVCMMAKQRKKEKTNTGRSTKDVQKILYSLSKNSASQCHQNHIILQYSIPQFVWHIATCESQQFACAKFVHSFRQHYPFIQYACHILRYLIFQSYSNTLVIIHYILSSSAHTYNLAFNIYILDKIEQKKIIFFGFLLLILSYFVTDEIEKFELGALFTGCTLQNVSRPYPFYRQ